MSDNYGYQLDSYTYDVFGSLVQGSLTGSTDFGYLGKQNDSTSKLYNYGYRDYRPEYARFTTVDPIRDGINWFAYVNNDPVNFVDLWGLCGSDLNLAGVPPQYRDSIITQYNNTHLIGSGNQLAFNMILLVGSNYVWGGNSPEDGGMDCSGSIIYGINQMGNNIADQTASQLYNLTSSVDGDIQPGDLRFLSDSKGNINHVQTIVNSDGTRVNANGGPENTIDTPGSIDLLPGPLPTSGEVRRLLFK